MDQKNPCKTDLKIEKPEPLEDKEIINDLLETRRKFVIAIAPTLIVLHSSFLGFVYFYCRTPSVRTFDKILYISLLIIWGLVEYKIFKFVLSEKKEK